MTITGIKYRFTMFSIHSDHSFDAYIPFTGEDQVITQITRCSYETEKKTYPLSRDMVSQYLSLIDEYKITEWIGRTPASPETYNDEKLHESSELTLIFDDGSESVITFREDSPETGKEAEIKFRKLYFSSTQNDAMLSEEKTYPNLKDCREIKENHGPVTAVETSHFSMGMMYNSNVTVKQKVEKIEGKDGIVLVTVTRKAGNLPEESDSKEFSSDIFSKIQEISDKENLAAWHYACVDPSIPVDRSMMPLDYSSSACLNIYYDDSLITGCPRVMRTIGEKACDMGGREIDRTITEMINECVRGSGAKVEAKDLNSYIASVPQDNVPQPQLNGFIGMGMFKMPGFVQQTSNVQETAGQQATEPAPVSNGPWDCNCGAKRLTGKFCPECGNPRV